eukprot:RCo018786
MTETGVMQKLFHGNWQFCGGKAMVAHGGPHDLGLNNIFSVSEKPREDHSKLLSNNKRLIPSANKLNHSIFQQTFTNAIRKISPRAEWKTRIECINHATGEDDLGLKPDPTIANNPAPRYRQLGRQVTMSQLHLRILNLVQNAGSPLRLQLQIVGKQSYVKGLLAILNVFPTLIDETE